MNTTNAASARNPNVVGFRSPNIPARFIPLDGVVSSVVAVSDPPPPLETDTFTAGALGANDDGNVDTIGFGTSTGNLVVVTGTAVTGRGAVAIGMRGANDGALTPKIVCIGVRDPMVGNRDDSGVVIAMLVSPSDAYMITAGDYGTV